MAGEDPAFVRWVHFLPCEAKRFEGHACAGRVTAHHAGHRGYGQRAHDRTAIALCRYAHLASAHDSGAPPFKGMSKEDRAAFFSAAISATNQRYARPFPVEARCPKCLELHLDDPGAPPHAEHVCADCGERWTPYEFATSGVMPSEADEQRRALTMDVL